MFHVKDDFKAGDPVSAVGAAWFNKVGSFLNNLVGGYGIRLAKSERGVSTVEVDPDALPSVSTETGTPDERTDAGTDDDSGGEEWTWEPNAEKGLVLDCYCKVVENDGWHMLCRARLTFSKAGLLVKAEGLKGRREIQG